MLHFHCTYQSLLMDFPETEDWKWQFHLRVAMRTRNTPAVPHSKSKVTRPGIYYLFPLKEKQNWNPHTK